jgi:hypothetical protein
LAALNIADIDLLEKLETVGLERGLANGFEMLQTETPLRRRLALHKDWIPSKGSSSSLAVCVIHSSSLSRAPPLPGARFRDGDFTLSLLLHFHALFVFLFRLTNPTCSQIPE